MTDTDTTTKTDEAAPADAITDAPPATDPPAADTPPEPTKTTRRKTTRRKTTARKRKPAASGDKSPRTTARRKRSLKKPVEELLGLVAGGVMFVNMTDAQIIEAGAPRLAEELDNLAQRNDLVYRWLEGLTTGTSNMSLLMAISAIAVPIMANHGMLPPQVAALMGFANMAATAEGDDQGDGIDLAAMMGAMMADDQAGTDPVVTDK